MPEPEQPLKDTLVQWDDIDGDKVGVVIEVRNGQVRVEFERGEEHIFSWPTETLHRFTFKPGDTVQTIPAHEIGVVTGVGQSDDLRVYTVVLPTRTVTVLEVGLRPAVITDPVELLRRGELDNARSTNLRLTATRLAIAHQFDELSSLSNSRVEIKPHQVSVVHRVATSYPHRFLLADQVGLGKTIEAGLIVKELKARGVANRVLILAPSGIVSQWQAEMRSKFNLAFSLYQRDTIAYLERNHLGENVWALNDNVLVSTAFATHNDDRCREIALAGWDLVVIDEAHHARRTWQGLHRYQETKLYELAEMLANPEAGSSAGMLLLTATPMQLHRFELYSLVELLDPTLFPNFEEFDRHCDALSGLNKTVQNLRMWSGISKSAKAETEIQVESWLEQPSDIFKAQLDQVEGREQLSRELAQKHRLSEVMIRNRKEVVGGFTPRVAAIWPVEMTDVEREAYNAVTQYVQTGYARSKIIKNNALGFVMVIFQKMNSSSSFAVRQSLLRRIEKLESSLAPANPEIDIEDGVLEEKPVEDALGDLLAARARDDVQQEIRDLVHLVQLLDSIEVDAKVRVLKDRLSGIAEQEPDAKVIIFTQFRDTQEYIKRHLVDTWEVELFHGELKPADKDEAVRRFREAAGNQVLISTEAGGEGRNFQFCHILINYNLPWNPMKIEQRIGRVDRYGQKHPVKVFNFSLLGTVEERVLDVLIRRIRVFEETIGGLDPVLGDVEMDLTKVFLLAEEQSRLELERLDRDLELRVRKARDTEQMLADLIMDTKSFRQDEVAGLLERKGGPGNDVMKSLILSTLEELHVDIERDPIDDVFVLKFGGHFADEFPHLAKEAKTRRVTFDPSVALDYETIEFLAFGHELVDALVDRLRADDYRGRASHRMIRSDAHEPLRGWLFTFFLEFEGVVPAKELLPIFISEFGGIDEEAAQWLIERAARAKWEDRPEAVLPPREHHFEEAVRIANERAIQRVIERREELGVLNQERLDVERDKLVRFYEYRERAAQDKLNSVRETYNRLAASEDPQVQKIVPVWSKNFVNAGRLLEEIGVDRDRRLAQLQGREQVTTQHQVFTASFVEIIPKAVLQ